MPPTEFEFTLPVGYTDASGVVHRTGAMRLATAMDEIAPLHDPRVRNNPAYLTIILLARVIVRLGTVQVLSTSIIESLYVADLAYLQALYRRINEQGKSIVALTCPNCHQAHEVDLADLGGV